MDSRHFPPVLKVGCVWNGKIADAVNERCLSFQKETWDWAFVVKWNEIFGNSAFVSLDSLLCFARIHSWQISGLLCCLCFFNFMIFFLIWRVRKEILPLERVPVGLNTACVLFVLLAEWMQKLNSFGDFPVENSSRSGPSSLGGMLLHNKLR